jgi:hypothetical protein
MPKSIELTEQLLPESGYAEACSQYQQKTGIKLNDGQPVDLDVVLGNPIIADPVNTRLIAHNLLNKYLGIVSPCHVRPEVTAENLGKIIRKRKRQTKLLASGIDTITKVFPKITPVLVKISDVATENHTGKK